MACVRRHHGLSDMAAKCLAKLLEVLHGSIYTELSWHMRISLASHTLIGFGSSLAPGLRKSEKEALIRRKTIDHVVALGRGLLRLKRLKCLIGNA